MIAVQIIILIVQLFLLYLTLVEMRKAREQQVLPFVTFEGLGSSGSDRGIVAHFALKNEGTGPAVEIRIYLQEKEVHHIAILSSSQIRKFDVGLSHYNWSSVSQGDHVLVTAEYQNLHNKKCTSSVKLKKGPQGNPRIMEDSFGFWREKDLFEVLEIKLCHIIKKLFSKES